jgi:twinkle protein
MTTGKSTWVKYHVPCSLCNSSDAVSVNEDGSAKCFSCGAFFPDYETPEKVKEQVEDNTFLSSYTGDYADLTDRGISKKTAKVFGVRCATNNSGDVKEHIYPFYNGDEIVGTKTRYVADKRFSFSGTFDNTGLFGEQLFRNKGGKYLTITEGECDAMATYQMFDGKYPVVSLKRGASGAVKDIRESIEFVESFQHVVLCFDNDKQGKEAAKLVARIIKPGKVKIMTLPNGYKDANDMLAQGKFTTFTQAFWEAKQYTPSGIIELSSRKGDWLHREVKPSIPYPWEGLNSKLYGLRKGELVTFTGGTGLGKSSVTRELEHWIIKNTKDNVGIIALEENWQRTADGIVSIEANDRIYLNEKRRNYSKEDLENMFDKVIEKDRVFIHAHLGANDIDDVFAKLRYIIVGCECQWVIVDHLHMLVNVLTEGDERRGIDTLMNKLRSLVEETGVGMLLVSHLRRAAGDKGHEQGIEVSLSHLKGSQGIAQLSDCVIALERNQQAKDKDEANTTRLRVLKSRYTGDTGLACSLMYDTETGRLHEKEPDEFDDVLNNIDDDYEKQLPW